ncbi:MAG: fasciclin domain-containing protein [Acaryochloris sp. RU_4_1]|nr:fasciclin domain-containing protein [Acaryochloris sp. RU_4_1]NJR55058.1 fasciclin domain-containing protein [Acaryochloris sp. CRU_2_0]
MKKQVLTIVSSLCLLAATSGIAAAESKKTETTSSDASTEELRPGVKEILCKNFPLNSRCTGNTETPTTETPAEEAPTTETPTTETPTGEAPTTETPTTETPEAAPPEAPPAEATPPEAVPSDKPSSEAPAPEMKDSSASSQGTIVDVASGNASFKTLVAAIKAANLVETLSGQGPFTVFAPTEDAFAALPPGTVDTLLKPENKDKLVKILSYHVVPTKAVSSELKSGDVATVAGDPVKVNVEGGTVKVNEASVVQADVMGSNGVIHAIDKVLLPPNLLK